MRFTLIVPIEVVYARERIDTSYAGYGALLASGAPASWSGARSTCGVKKHSPAWTLIIASTFATIGVGYIGLALAQTLAVACVVSIIGGAGNGIQWIAVMTALQEKTPLELPGANQRA